MKIVLTDEQIEHGREATFSTDNPFCPCNAKTMRKAVRWAEHAILQSPEVQALRKDAERYQHIRDFTDTGPRDVFGVWWLSEHGHPTTLDEALDISIKEES